MRILLILAGLTLSLAAASQEIWRWVDKNGIVHYSDQPDSPNAELISVIESNTYEGAEATPDSSASGDSSDQDSDSTSGVSPYDSLSIVQPSPDQVFFGADAVVTAVADLQGTLRPDHSVVFFLNGNRRPSASLDMEFSGPCARHVFPAREHPRPGRRAGDHEPADHLPCAAAFNQFSAEPTGTKAAAEADAQADAQARDAARRQLIRGTPPESRNGA